MDTHPTGDPEVKSDLGEIRRKLAWRMGFAGLMIVALLGGLVLFDRMSVRHNEPESNAPQFTEAVPVAKKSLTQPVTPAEPTPPSPLPSPESSAAPIDTAAPALSEPPPRPEVAAQPTLPRATSPTAPAGRPSPSVSGPAPAAGKAAEPKASVGGALAPRSEPPQPAGLVPSPAPRPLLGYALQAGVFADPRRAEELHAKLALEGIPSTIEARVQAGPFKTRQEAEAMRARMKGLGIDTVLLLPKAVRR